MKRGFLCGVIVLGAIAAPAAQQGQGRGSVSPTAAETLTTVQAALQGLNGALTRTAVESRVTKGAPYSADAITEFTQVLADGNRISRKTVTRNFRDSEGRTRREQTTALAGGGERTTITIVDPVAGTSAVLDPENRTATRNHAIIAMPARIPPSGFGSGTGEGVARGGGGGGRGGSITTTAPAPVPATAGAGGRGRGGVERVNAGNSNSTVDNLAQQTIEGVLVEGTRTTTVIAAGSIGNAQPIKIVSEQWFSPDLQLLVMTRHSDPRTGETTYRLGNIIRGEQDRSLFEIPADYTVKSPGRQPQAH